MPAIQKIQRAGRLLASALLLASAATTCRARQTAAEDAPPPVELDALTVTATRAPLEIRLAPGAVTVLDPGALERFQTPDLRSALQTVPGVNVLNLGAPGSLSKINIRGAGATHTLLLVDGIRVNSQDDTNSYANLLGAGGLEGLGRLEVLRGPQSVLYGSSALGGVVALETARASGPPALAAAVNAGSFNTRGADATFSGNLAPDALSASLAASILSTDNDRDANALSRQAAAARLEWAPAAPLTLGATCRLAENDYHEPGMLHDPSSAGHALSRFAIATLYAEARPLASLASRLTLGLVKNSYRWDQTAYPSRMDARRLVLDWQNTFRPNPRLLLLAGLNAETSRYNNAGATLRDDLRSAFFNLTLEPFATPSATTRRDTGLTLVLGARADDYDTFNTRLTHRAGLAWRPAKAAPVFRANYGTGFNAPSPSYLLGGGWYAPSPTLKPERSKGWDFSLEQDLFNGQAAAGAAWFKNEFKDKFDFSTYDPVTWQTRVGNIPGAVTQGVELFLNVRPSPQKIPALRLAYTYLDARDSAGRRLVSQPRHLLSADANHRVLPNWLVGAGLTLVAGRPDESYYDPATFSNVPQEMASHTLVRLYTAWDVTARVTLRLRAENLLDTTYQPVADYPGLPFSLHASLQWKF